MSVLVRDRTELDLARYVAADLHAGGSHLQLSGPTPAVVTVIEHLARVGVWPVGGIRVDVTNDRSDADDHRLRTIAGRELRGPSCPMFAAWNLS